MHLILKCGQFCLISFHSRPEYQVWKRRTENQSLKGRKSPAFEDSVCETQLYGYKKKKRKKSSLTGGCKKEDKLPLEQQKQMTSQYCHSCKLTPRCSMEMGIDWDPRATKNSEVSAMSNMHGLKDQYKVLISNWWNAFLAGFRDNLIRWFISGRNTRHNMWYPCVPTYMVPQKDMK